MSFIGKLFGNADDTEKERTLAVQYWESGQYENCINVCMGIREKILRRIAKGKHDDFSIPFVNYYIYLGLYYLQRWQDAYDFLHDGLFMHRPEDHAHFMSIAMELAYRIGEPAETIIKFGELCYDARQKANNIQGIIDCAFTACNTLGMMDECGKNRFFADILIQVGKEHRKPEALILGYGYLADNFLQCLDPAIGKDLADAKRRWNLQSCLLSIGQTEA
ncbi:MAG: hypothetical protein HC887_00610 [Desulfobacteraceae bacterium]|nr:hypothetical protein [Desulfobacteraceae bacterium]